MSYSSYFVSVDIETDGPNMFRHSMRSIGAVAYDSRLAEVGRMAVNILAPINAETDPETMEFWGKHPKAWAALCENAVSRGDAMREFCDWIEALCPGLRRFIAHPTWFDYGWVRQYALEYAGRDPFNRLVGDYAQQAWAAGIKVPRIHNPTPHIALADADEQGQQFVAVMRALRRDQSNG